MKLQACLSKEYAVFSVGHHDCRVAPDGTMADGGQAGLQDYAGYQRATRPMQWIELPGVTWAELVNDYHRPEGIKRKYGVHKIEEVRILPDSEIPDIKDIDWKALNFVWGTMGKNGNEPFRYIHLAQANDDHLKAIIHTQPQISADTRKIIRYILKKHKEVDGMLADMKKKWRL